MTSREPSAGLRLARGALRILTATALLTASALAAGTAYAGAPAASAEDTAARTGLSGKHEGRPQLRSEGRWLVDPQGRIVLLHGVNAVWKRPPYCPPDEPGGFREEDAAWLAEHGFNTVRLGVLFAGVMPERGQVVAGYLDCIDRVVDLLAAHGIWVQLDAHQDLYSERYGGEGFPDWAVDDDGVPPPQGPADLGFPGNYFHPATSRAFDNLYADSAGQQQGFARSWRAVAERWADQPYLMGYDLLNEPWPGTDWLQCVNPLGCPVFDSYDLQPLFERLLAEIRRVDQRNVVWVEPNVTFNSGAPNGFDTLRPFPDDENLGFSWHDYCLVRETPDNPRLCDIPEALVVEHAETAANRLDAATLLSEFGATDDLPDLRTITALADGHLTSWQYWHYKGWSDPTTVGGADHQSLFRDDSDLSSVKQDKLRILERTYPQATAGVPRELEFDPDSGDFRYAYEPRPATGPTVIYAPELHYPRGYEVDVRDGRVTSAPDAERLTVRAAPGADEVVVEVAARES